MKLKNIISLAITMLFTVVMFNTYAQSQSQMNSQAYAKYQKVDKELNQVYQKILKEYAAQPAFIKNLKAAQRLWVQLRDAELAAKYPQSEIYGSMGPMCRAIYLSDLTTERIKFLKVWLDGIPEGDACAGSVKTK
jgi:uncharacterized protein YecT (DUF1311 family)